MNFALAENHFRVWQPGTGRTLARDPVLVRTSPATARSMLVMIAGTRASPGCTPMRAVGRKRNFALAENHFRVWQPGTGRTLARDPVLTWASRSRYFGERGRGAGTIEPCWGDEACDRGARDIFQQALARHGPDAGA
jgi:hypothetical protein